MSKKQIKKYQTELEFICSCSRSQRNNFFKLTPKKKLNSILKCLSHISNTLLYDKSLANQLSKKPRNKLKKFIPSLKRLAKKSNGLSKKRFLSSQKGGNLLSVIWNTIKSIFSE